VKRGRWLRGFNGGKNEKSAKEKEYASGIGEEQEELLEIEKGLQCISKEEELSSRVRPRQEEEGRDKKLMQIRKRAKVERSQERKYSVYQLRTTKKRKDQ